MEFSFNSSVARRISRRKISRKEKKKNRPRRLKSPRDDKSLMRAVPCRNHSSPSFGFFIFSPLRVTTDLSYSSIKR